MKNLVKSRNPRYNKRSWDTSLRDYLEEIYEWPGLLFLPYASRLCTTCSDARHTKRSRGLVSFFLLFCMHIDHPPEVIIITYIFLSKSGHVLLYNVIITFIFLSESGQTFLYLITSKLYTNHVTYYSIKRRVSSKKNYKNVLYAEKKCMQLVHTCMKSYMLI